MRFPVKGDITLEDVHFSYATRPDAPVLRGVNGVIKQGECVAIVGASGCGKSTIGSLLQRLYEPSAGRLTIGGFNIADADVAWLRDHVAVVSQHPMLFDTSIAENITYGSEPGRFSREDIRRAAQAANLDDFIQTLPNGYETTIGEKAALLSGGQAQRLQIARALVNGRAQIMVFDECTSSLDPANQAAVMHTITSVKEGRTTLLITHKVPVMQMCDRILVVDGGRIVEEGTFDELIQKRGTFHQLAGAGEWASLD
jgi:ATP-binding cassette subfamily B (MDR/TAP) protein 1